MRKIQKPTFEIKTIVFDCISNMTNEDLKAGFEGGLEQIVAAEVEYDEKKYGNKLYEIGQDLQISDLVSKIELKKIYSDRFSNKKHVARKYYDQLLISAPNGKCPQCAVRLATTLDHNLPKSKYPLLAVSPLNLIPSCSDCNKGKHIEFPTNAIEETIHPYYDDIESIKWLHCKVISVKPFLIEFYVDTPENTDQLLTQRIIKHFLSFELNSLYTVHAAEDYSNSFAQMTNLFNGGGRDLLKTHIQESFTSRSLVNINSWQTTFYGGLLSCEDFLNGNFI